MTTESSNEGSSTRQPIRLAPYLSWESRTTRLVAAGAAILAVAFAVGAFLVVPMLVDSAVRRYAARLPERSAAIERVSVNPFNLTVELGGVDLREPQAGASLTAERVRLNFHFSTLFQRALVFDEMSIEQPYLRIDLSDEGDDSSAFDFDAWLSAMIPSQPIRIRRFEIAAGQVEIGDDSPAGERRLMFDNVTVAADGFASDSQAPGSYVLTAREAGGATLRLDGELSFAPLATRGRMSAEALALDSLRPWLDERFAAAQAAGSVDLTGEYALSHGPDAAGIRLIGVTAALRTLSLVLDGGLDADAGEVELEADAEVVLSDGVWRAAADGGFDLADVAIRDASGERVFASERVTASGVSLESVESDGNTGGMSIDVLRLQHPETSIFIGSSEEEVASQDRTLGIDHALDGVLSVGGSRRGRVPVRQVHLVDAALDIVDRGFSPPAILRSSEVAGTVTLGAEDEGLLVEMSGQVGETGSGRITMRMAGDEAAEHRALEIVARDIAAAAASPHFSKFTGRDLTGGLLDMDVEYRMSGDQVEGHARIAARDLALADRGAAEGVQEALPAESNRLNSREGIARPEEALWANLRWDLAAALLEDEQGRLEVATSLSGSNTPVSGSTTPGSGLNGPGEFRGSPGANGATAIAGSAAAAREDGVAGAVVAALGDVVARLTSAPFAVLGDLAGRDGNSLRSIPFDPGAAAPSETGMDALEDLSRALTQRPQLALLISGRADPELDRDALAAQQIELHVTLATAGPTLVARPQPVDFSSPRAWDVLDEFATERLTEEELATIASYFPLDSAGQVAAAEKPSYYRALFDALVANEPIPENALNRLGRYRAQSIADALAALGVSADRTVLLDPKVTAASREPAPLRPSESPPQLDAALQASDAAPADFVQQSEGEAIQESAAPQTNVPERIVIPLELQALASLESDPVLGAVTAE